MKLIELKLSRAKGEFYIRADLIMTIGRDQKNPLETMVGTSIMTTQGPLTYPCLNGVHELADVVNRALDPQHPPALTN